MKDDEIEDEEAAAWSEYHYSQAEEQLYQELYEGKNLTKEDIEMHESVFRSTLMPEDLPYQSPRCTKCGANTISLFLFNGKKTFIRCISCKHSTSIHT